MTPKKPIEDPGEARRARNRASAKKRRAERKKTEDSFVKKRNSKGGANVNISKTSADIVFENASLDDWDDEELLRGQRRNAKTGKLPTKAPQVVPARLVQELTKRRFSRAHALMTISLTDAVEMLGSLVKDKGVEPRDRIRAAEIIMDRLLGKPRESVSIDMFADLDAEAPAYKRLMTKAIVATASEAMDLLDEQRENELKKEMHPDDVPQTVKAALRDQEVDEQYIPEDPGADVVVEGEIVEEGP